LATSLDPARLIVHLAGARSGNQMLKRWSGFRQDLVVIGFDADSDAVDEATSALRSDAETVAVLPHALGARAEEARFHLNHDPCTSSIFPLNPDYADFLMLLDSSDYVLGEVAAPVSVSPMPVTPLDSLIGCSIPTLDDAALPPPDLLLLDTQGSEVDILEGAVGCLQSRTVAVVAETAFHPVYDGQKTFGDMVRLMETNGFLFAGFDEFGYYMPHRVPVPWRGGGMPLFCDAVFLRRLDRLPRSPDPAGPDALILAKAALLALGLDQPEYALAVLERIPGIGRASTAGYSYQVFLGRLAALWQQLGAQAPLPLRHVELFDAAASDAVASGLRTRDSYLAGTGLAQFGQDEASPVEALLSAHGFDRLAKQVRRYRRNTTFRIREGGTGPAGGG